MLVEQPHNLQPLLKGTKEGQEEQEEQRKDRRNKGRTGGTTTTSTTTRPAGAGQVMQEPDIGFRAGVLFQDGGEAERTNNLSQRLFEVGKGKSFFVVCCVSVHLTY